MDDIDRKILSYAQQHGRDTYAEIGAAVGLSVSAVNERLKKLQASGTIQGWQARVDPLALDLRLLAFQFVLIDKPQNEKPFLVAVTTHAEVQECHHITGEWSYLLKLRVADTAALERLVGEVVKAQRGVVRTLTMIALSSAKESAALPVDLP